MKFGLSSASFYPEVTTEESIPLMKKLGFDYGEIFLNSPSEYEQEFVDILLEIKEKNQFNITSIHGFSSSFEPYLFDRYKRRRKDMLKYFKDICSAAKKLGANCYTFHGLRTLDFKQIDRGFVIEIFDELTYLAAEIGIKLAQENVSWCMSSDLEYLSLLRDKCKYPLYFTLDIKQAYKAGIEPEKYINIMGDKIVNFHVNDRDDENICLLPGKGNVDYKKIITSLNKVQYDSIGIIEVYKENYVNYGELTNSKKFMESISKM